MFFFVCRSLYGSILFLDVGKPLRHASPRHSLESCLPTGDLAPHLCRGLYPCPCCCGYPRGRRTPTAAASLVPLLRVLDVIGMIELIRMTDMSAAFGIALARARILVFLQLGDYFRWMCSSLDGVASFRVCP